MNYDGRRFRGVVNSDDGDVSTETIFEYRQQGDLVHGTYSGGTVIAGSLLATVDDDGNLDMAYQHLSDGGSVCTGRCRSTPELLPDGRLRLHERWHWTSGREGSGESVVEEIARDGAEAAAEPRGRLELVTLVVEEYDPAIDFFVEVLGFELIDDSPSLTNDGRQKRWVVVRPPGGEAGVLLARADGERQERVVGEQLAGRVGFFLRVADFDGALARMEAAGVEFVGAPRTEPYGRVVVFRDLAGNRWDLLGPAAT